MFSAANPVMCSRAVVGTISTGTPSIAARWLAAISLVIRFRFSLPLCRTFLIDSAPIPSSRPRRFDPPGPKRRSAQMPPASDVSWEMLPAATRRREFVSFLPALTGSAAAWSSPAVAVRVYPRGCGPLGSPSTERFNAKGRGVVFSCCWAPVLAQAAPAAPALRPGVVPRLRRRVSRGPVGRAVVDGRRVLALSVDPVENLGGACPWRGVQVTP